jgi:hypothetical protein
MSRMRFISKDAQAAYEKKCFAKCGNSKTAGCTTKCNSLYKNFSDKNAAFNVWKKPSVLSNCVSNCDGTASTEEKCSD